MNCSPHREGNKLTCFSKDNLVKIAMAYNKRSKGEYINIKNKNKTQLWNSIRKKMSDTCDTEICWIDKDFIDNKNKFYESFRPKMPVKWKQEKYTTWLSTTDINEVMKQYELKYKDFMFIGPVPLDCGIDGNLRCELTNLNINKAKKDGINKLGIIYNHDKSYQNGSHWTAVYVDLNKKDITYYDSFANRPLIEIFALMKKIQSDYKKKNNINLKIDWNKRRHQYDTFNCGVYSMNYIINRLKGKTLNQIEKIKIPTSEMQEMKKYLYRNA